MRLAIFLSTLAAAVSAFGVHSSQKRTISTLFLPKPTVILLSEDDKKRTALGMKTGTVGEGTSYMVGEWLPSDHSHREKWLKARIEELDDRAFHPVITKFQEFIEGDPAVFMLFDEMFKQVRHHISPTGEPQVKDYMQMLRLLNRIMTSAPPFDKTGLVGFPINAILDWSMGTTGGHAAFLMDKVNAHLKPILDEWGVFLASKDSASVLNENETSGWLGTTALKAMAPDGHKNPRQYFIDTFVCDPDKPHFGFTSWDDFFTRELREGARPVVSMDDDTVIVNACESAPFALKRNVQRRAKFWMKGQPYSLDHMLANDEYVDQFVNGTVYQAFLNAKSYHRWHSPVNGIIVKTYNVPGSYYSESLANRHDPEGPNDSQGYITAVAARAIIFIQADNPQIGLMCFLAVGMAEVSTNEITVYEGQRVKKGDQLGTFHFGGSTHCLIFRPQTNVQFDLRGQEPGLNAHNILINQDIATVS